MANFAPESRAQRAFTLTGVLRWPAMGAPVPFSAEALPPGAARARDISLAEALQ